MANYYKLERPLTVNDSEGNSIEIPVGNYVLTEATGLLSHCIEDELQSNIARIDADIAARDAQIAADELLKEQVVEDPII